MKAAYPIVTIRYKTIHWRDFVEPADLYAVGGMVLAALCFLLGFVARGL